MTDSKEQVMMPLDKDARIAELKQQVSELTLRNKRLQDALASNVELSVMADLNEYVVKLWSERELLRAENAILKQRLDKIKKVFSPIYGNGRQR